MSPRMAAQPLAGKSDPEQMKEIITSGKANIVEMGVSVKQSPAYQSMPEYETISERFEKLQVSFSRGMERMGYDGRRVGSAG